MKSAWNILTISLLILLTYIAGVAADDEWPEPPARIPDTWIVVPAEGAITKNILFIMDKSGSMKPSELIRGIDTIMTIVEQPVDEMNITGMVFANGTSEWVGPSKKSDKLPMRWLELPSKDGLKEFHNWITSATVDDSETNLVGALIKGLEITIEPLTIIAVTDGGITGSPLSEIITIVAKANKNRQYPVQLGFILTQVAPAEVRDEFKTFCADNHFFLFQLN